MVVAVKFNKALKIGLVFTLTSVLLSGCSAADIPLIGGLFKGSTGFSGKAQLTYWGLFESPDSYKPLINDYKDKHQGVEIDYQQKSYSTLSQYKETLLNRFREGKGPDIVRIHSSWLRDFQPFLAPLPTKVISKDEYSKSFFPVIKDGSSVGDIIYGIPLMYDGLMLFANKKLLSEAAVTLPRTWDEFRQAVVRLSKIDPQTKKITQSGAALGSYSNIPHAVDILSLMFLQSNLRIPEDLGTQAAADALTFYTNFITIDRVWDETFPSSIVSFARGQTAMIISPSWRILDIKNLNPSIDIITGGVPQVPNLEGVTSNEVSLASFWIEVVSKDSKGKEAAFDFLKFLSSPDQLRKIYVLQSQNRTFGEPYPSKDAADGLSTDPYLAPLMSGAPRAKVAPFNDGVGDDPYVEAMGGAINSAVRGGDPKQALSNAKKTIEQLQSSNAPKPTTKK